MIPSHQLPLHGRRILITAPRNYAARLAQAITDKGGLPILIPTIETCYLDDFQELDRVLNQLDKFTWVAFTSRNGIDAIWQRIQVLSLNIHNYKNLSYCAIGEDAKRLINLGLIVDLIPNEPSPTGIIQELAKIPDIQNQKILVPVPQVIGIPEPDVVPKFISGLVELGMEVTRINAYQTRIINKIKQFYDAELDLLRQGKIYAIAFSSTAEITAFLSIFNGSGEAVNQLVHQHNCKIACFGPYTAGNARELGLHVDIIAKDFSSFVGFAEALAGLK